MTTISRVLGLVRDVVIAYFFGARFGTDAFFVAFKIPNLFRRMFAEGAFNQAFVPVLSEYKETREQQAVLGLVGATVGALGAVLVVITALGIFAAPFLITIFAPGFTESADKVTLAAEMLRWTFPYLLFISLTALFGGVLNTYGRFAIPAITPALLNVAIITVVLLIAPQLERPIMGLAMGVFAGGVVQLGLQIAAVAKLGLLGPVRLGFGDAGVKRIMRLMAPAMFGASVSQINLLLDTLIASLLTVGSISWLYYSDRLVEFPLGVFGIALATVILPNLSRQFTRGDSEMFSATLDWALRLVLMIALPAAVALAVLATPLLATIFFYGKFGLNDLAMASNSLVAYSFGLIAFILIKILAPAYFSRQDTKTPVKVGIVAMLVNLSLNLLLMGPMGHTGLALATSIAAFVNAGLLFWGLKRQGIYQSGTGWFALLLKVTVACLAMSAVLLLTNQYFGDWYAGAISHRVGILTYLVVSGTLTYFASLFLLGLRRADVMPPASPV